MHRPTAEPAWLPEYLLIGFYYIIFIIKKFICYRTVIFYLHFIGGSMWTGG